MAIPLIPVAGLALGALASLSLLAIQNLLQDRSFGSDPVLPNPSSQVPPFTPPFTGGQCTNLVYDIKFTQTHPDPNYTFSDGSKGSRQITRTDIGNNIQGAIVSFGTRQRNDGFFGFTTIPTVTNSAGLTKDLNDGGGAALGVAYTYSGFIVTPQGGASDSCGNLPNPNPPVPPSVGGGSLVPVVDSPIEVFGGIPIPSFAALLAALKTIADGIAAIGNVLDGVRQIGDAINKIREILDDFLNRWNDKEKENPRKRKISVGGWRELSVDGGFGTAKFTAQGIEYSPYQLQIEVQSFPSTVSRRLGVNSPTYAHLEPIGWIFLRSANGGYSEPVPIRYLRNSISLNEDTNGISYSFRENPLAKAKCRIWYSSAPSITGNI